MTPREQVAAWARQLLKPLAPGQEPPPLPYEVAQWSEFTTRGIVLGFGVGAVHGWLTHRRLVAQYGVTVSQTAATAYRNPSSLAKQQVLGLSDALKASHAPGSFVHATASKYPNLSRRNTAMLLMTRGALRHGVGTGALAALASATEQAVSLAAQDRASWHPAAGGATATAATFVATLARVGPALWADALAVLSMTAARALELRFAPSRPQADPETEEAVPSEAVASSVAAAVELLQYQSATQAALAAAQKEEKTAQ